MEDDNVAAVITPEQFKALGHPMRHRLLFALAQGEATISQLAVALGSNKGNVAHHLKVLAGAGLVRPAATRAVRGGTEQYYRRASPGLRYDDAATTQTAFRALAAEIAAAQPEPFLVLRTLRLSPAHAEQITAILRDLASQADDGADQTPYGLLLGLYQPAQPPPSRPVAPAPPGAPPAAGEPRQPGGHIPPERGIS
jgi:DNA-binding transcriptional ArsR family regulator